MNLTWLMLGAGGLVLLGLLSWRYAIFGALVLVIAEGAIRKWLLPQASQAVYFAKDLLLLGAYGNYFIVHGEKPRIRLGEGLTFLLFGSVAWTFLESFNSGTGSLSAGLFGWKAYVFYVPLFIMVPSLFQTQDELEKFLRYYLLLALPVCVLGVTQFYAPPDSPLNTYAPGVSGSETTEVAVFGEDQFVRVTGTFSYISGYSAYLAVVLALVLPFLAWTKDMRWRFLFIGTLCLILGNMMMTGSRSTALAAAFIVVGYIGLTLLMGGPEEQSRGWVHALAVACAIFAALLFFERAASALQERAQAGFTEGENQKRLWAAIFEPWSFLGMAGFMGHGNGISQPAVNALRTALSLPPPQQEYSSPTDAENSRVLMELGIPGFLLWYGMRICLLVTLWKISRRLKSSFLRQLGLGSWLVLFFQLFTVTMFTHTANIYHWFLAGLILLLPNLDSNASASRAERRRKANRPRSRPDPAGVANQGPLPDSGT